MFVSDRRSPNVLKMMLQKPSTELLSELLKDHFYLTDIGIWLLSDRAVKLLMKRSMKEDGTLKEYDMYSEFGCTLGTHPTIDDPELHELSVAIVPLQGGEFYHFGTSGEMISSTMAIQNIVNDQRDIMHHDRKPHPSIFTQNADHIITGVPDNDWTITLEPGQCVDIIPIGEKQYCVRRYDINEKFAGAAQQEKRFPVLDSLDGLDNLDNLESIAVGFLSAEDISNVANLRRLFAQRKVFRSRNWPALARNWQHSVFYQLDLDDAAREFKEMNLSQPAALPVEAPLMTRIHDCMFHGDSDGAFSLLREGLTAGVLASKQTPRLSVYPDQIVWGRSPVRIDLAGGWTDTPPYCLMEGGSVVNIAIELTQ